MLYSFEKLNVYQKAKSLVKDVYSLLKQFPNEERYALCDQIRRAIISVPSNIAEQSGRVSPKEKIHFLEIAYGSLMETYCQLSIAVDLGYISDSDLDILKQNFEDIAKLISGLRHRLFQSLSSNPPIINSKL